MGGHDLTCGLMYTVQPKVLHRGEEAILYLDLIDCEVNASLDLEEEAMTLQFQRTIQQTAMIYNQ